MGAQIQSNPYKAMMDLFPTELYHMEHFLNPLGHTALLLLWKKRCGGPDKGQKYANQILKKNKWNKGWFYNTRADILHTMLVWPNIQNRDVWINKSAFY